MLRVKTTTPKVPRRLPDIPSMREVNKFWTHINYDLLIRLINIKERE